MIKLGPRYNEIIIKNRNYVEFVDKRFNTRFMNNTNNELESVL